jgi:uncharacterized protein YecE (DUF72 family)
VGSTFYLTPAYSTVNGWCERTPPDFVFAAKIPQVITHEKILHGCEAEMDEFQQRLPRIIAGEMIFDVNRIVG